MRAPLLLAALASLSGCQLLVPASRDPHDLAVAQERASCPGFEVDARLVSASVVERVEPLLTRVPSKSGHDTHLRGARLRIRPQPGLTATLLERTLRCHAARQALGQGPADDATPYWLPEGWVTIEVTTDADAFAVSLSSDDHPSAQRTLDRARAFVASRPPQSPGAP